MYCYSISQCMWQNFIWTLPIMIPIVGLLILVIWREEIKDWIRRGKLFEKD